MEFDTIVCPAHEDGLNAIFLKQHRWYALTLKKTHLYKLKYIALYERRPISAIRYIGKIKEIRLYQNTEKYEIILTGKPKKIKKIKLTKKDSTLALQSRRYTSKILINTAKTLDDLFVE